MFVLPCFGMQARGLFNFKAQGLLLAVAAVSPTRAEGKVAAMVLGGMANKGAGINFVFIDRDKANDTARW